jgi:hypothetical protein
MALSVRQANTQRTTSNSQTTLVFNTSNAAIVGDVYVLGIAGNVVGNVSSVADSAGQTWTKLEREDFYSDIEIWYAPITVSAATPTITITNSIGAPLTACLYQLTGVDTSNITDLFGLVHGNGFNNNNPNFSTGNTGFANEIVIVFASISQTGVNTVSPDTVNYGFGLSTNSTPTTGNVVSMGAMAKVVSSAGPQSGMLTLASVANNWELAYVTLRGAGQTVARNLSVTDTVTTSEGTHSASIQATAPFDVYKQKDIEYKVYSPTGTYLGNWNNAVISDIDWQEEINSFGAEVEVVLQRPADNFGEGADVSLDNTVEIYIYDKEQPNGLLIFAGYISAYKPIFNSADNPEHVEVTVLSYGADLDNYIVENATPTNPYYTVSLSGGAHNTSGAWGGVTGGLNNDVGFSFISSGTAITKLQAELYGTGSGTDGPVSCTIYNDNAGKPGTAISSPVTISSLTTVSGSAATFDFTNGGATSGVTVNPNSLYWAVFTAPLATDLLRWVETLGNPDPRLSTIIGSSTNNTWTYWNAGGVAGGGNLLLFSVWDNSVDTTVIYTDTDPSIMAMDVLARLALQGCRVGFDTTTIDLTGTTVDYTFNTASGLEALNQIQDFLPPGWYMRLDVATNMLHIHDVSQNATQTFILGQHILDLEPQKRVEKIVNTVYVSGDGVFSKYVNQPSVDLFGTRQYRYSDPNLSSQATSDVIGKKLSNSNSSYEILAQLEILDSAAGLEGFDIESIQIGQLVQFGAILGTGTSRLDEMYLDQDALDGALANLNALALQIVRREYLYDRVRLQLSNQTYDVSKAIDRIERKILAIQQANNPTQPDSGS